VSSALGVRKQQSEPSDDGLLSKDFLEGLRSKWPAEQRRRPLAALRLPLPWLATDTFCRTLHDRSNAKTHRAASSSPPTQPADMPRLWRSLAIESYSAA
jgi:hypothetical protein